MTAPSQLYPLSSQDGKAIPLEICAPLALRSYVLVANTKKDIVIPADWVIGWLYSDVDCVFSHSDTDLPAALVDGTVYTSASFVPKKTPMAIKWIPGDASVLPLASGRIYLHKIEKWAAFVQSKQTTVG